MGVGREGSKWIFFDSQVTSAVSDPVALVAGGDKYVIVGGAFGGGIVTLEMSNSKGEYVPISGGILTEPQAVLLRGIPKSASIRANLTGAAGAALDLEITL